MRVCVFAAEWQLTVDANCSPCHESSGAWPVLPVLVSFCYPISMNGLSLFFLLVDVSIPLFVAKLMFLSLCLS